MKVIKILLIVIFVIVAVNMCINTCSDTPKYTKVEIVKAPDGVKIVNVSSTVDEWKGLFKLEGDFINDSKKKIPFQQITVELYAEDGKLISAPYTSSGTDEFVQPGAKNHWYITYPTKRPATAKIFVFDPFE